LSYGHHHLVRKQDFKIRISFCKQRTRLSLFDLFICKPVEHQIAITVSVRPIIAPCHRIRRISSILLAGLFFLLWPVDLWAQGDDPSETFLKAYLSAQQGEKLEHENRFKTALAKYRFAGSLIEELRRSHGDWQPAIVEYRGRKISEGILRIQERISRQNELSAGASRLPEVVPSLPESEAWSEPGPEVVAPQADETITQVSRDAAIEEATKKLRSKVAQLQAALEKSRSDLETARKGKEVVDTRLQETSSTLEKTQNEIGKSKRSEHQARDQLAQAQQSLKALQASQENSTEEHQQLRAEIAHLKDAVAVADEARVTAEKQRDEAKEKFAEANKQITTLEQEREEALGQLKEVRETEQQAHAVLAENGDLREKLADAEKRIREVGEGKPTNAEEFDEVKRQVAQIQQQLAESQKRNQYLVARIAELWVQLDETGGQLQNATLTGKNSEETVRLTRENELLRNIVVRERQEEARRDEARKLMLAELDKLKIKSAALNKQIEFLAQPVAKLSSEELALLRQPLVSVSDQNPGVLTASFIFAKKSPEESVEIAKPNANAKSASGSEATLNNSGGFKEDLPDELPSFAGAAGESFGGPNTERQKAIWGNPDQKSQ
jgi:myosin heavy subunit